MGLKDMSTLRGVSEEIVKSFLDDSLALGSPAVPLKRLEEFFDSKTIIYLVRVEFLADKLPQEIEEEINLDSGAVITIESREVRWRSLPFVYLLKREIPIKFDSFKKMAKAETKLGKYVFVEIGKLLLTLALMGCEWTAIGGFAYGPTYPFWPRRDMEDFIDVSLQMGLPALIKSKSQVKMDTVKNDFPEKLRKLGFEPVPERLAKLLDELCEYGPWHPCQGTLASIGIEIDSLREIMLRMLRNAISLIILKPFSDENFKDYDEIVDMMEKSTYFTDFKV